MSLQEREQPRRTPTPEDGDPEPEPDEGPPTVRVRSTTTCPLCHEDLTALPKLTVCPECQTIHHETCVEEMGRCATIGCRGLEQHPQGAVSSESRSLACVAHVANLAGGAVWVPLAIYLLARGKKDAFAAHHAQQALLLSLAVVVTLGLAAPLLLFFSVLGAVRGYRGQWYAFPVLGRFADEQAKAKIAAAKERRPAPEKTSSKGKAAG